MTIRVALADRELLVAQALARLIDFEPDMTVIRIYTDARPLVRGLAACDADVVVLDPVGLNGMGFEIIRRIRSVNPHIHIVILTASEREMHLFSAVRAGVKGYVSKSADVGELQRAIRAAVRGEAVLSQGRAAQLMEGFARQSYDQTGLSPRQRDLLCGIVQGKSNREIARDLDLAEKTVKNYMRGLFATLGVRDRTEAAVRALQTDLVAEREWVSMVDPSPTLT